MADDESAGNQSRKPTRDAEILFRRMFDLWKRGRLKGWQDFYVHQSTMAEWLGRTERSIKNYLRQMEAAGWIRRIRGYRSNRYIFLKTPDEAMPVTGEKLSPERGKSFPLTGEKLSPERGKSFPLTGEKLSPGLITNANTEDRDQQQAAEPRPAAAAADLFNNVEIEDATKALTALDLPESLARPAAERDCRLAIAVATWAAMRFKVDHRKSIRNKVGFVRKALEFPETYGFTRQADGSWLAPKEPTANGFRERLRQLCDFDKKLAAETPLEKLQARPTSPTNATYRRLLESIGVTPEQSEYSDLVQGVIKSGVQFLLKGASPTEPPQE